MSTQTTNYKLTKPATTDKYNVTIFNANADIIDTQMKANADAAGSKQPKITGAATTITDANLTVSRALVSNGTGKVAVSEVTSTELGYLDGVTSGIQGQLDGKLPKGGTAVKATADASGNTITTTYATKSEVNTAVADLEEQIGGMQDTITGAASTIVSDNLTASRVVVSNASGKVAVSDVTATELGYLDGVTSAIQTQINTAQSTADTARTNAGRAQITADGKQDPIKAGTGIAIGDDGKTINHSNSIDGRTVGSETTIPVITFDDQGHITATSVKYVYPPTSKGSLNQYWRSDGEGTGTWMTPATTPNSNSDTLISAKGVYDALQSYAKVSDLTSVQTAVGHAQSKADSAYTLAYGKQDPITVDSALDGASTNPIQNKVVNEAIYNLGVQLRNEMAGKQSKITVSTSEPTSSDGVDGDIWIVYEE